MVWPDNATRRDKRGTTYGFCFRASGRGGGGYKSDSKTAEKRRKTHIGGQMVAGTLVLESLGQCRFVKCFRGRRQSVISDEDLEHRGFEFLSNDIALNKFHSTQNKLNVLE